MKGALVFLVVFALALVITLGNTALPPGKALYDLFFPNTAAAAGYLVAGTVDAITGIISVFNGVIYGVIAWIVFSLLMITRKKEKPQNITQIVNVNLGDKTQPPPPPS